VFDPAERAMALAERRASRGRVAVTRGYGDFWRGAGIDRVTLAKSLPSLLDTADELKAMAGKLGAAARDIHLGSDASEATVKRTTLADYRVAYFATHGLVAGDVAGLGEPALALTLPKQPTELDDGLLTASEVAQLKLNVDWVVLSACNTAAADKPGAEALSGLARAFFYAGARALLVSHWSVDSEAATRLTTSTFAVMKSDPKLGRAEALRHAMLTYMNDKSSPLNAYPAFWGHFPSSVRGRRDRDRKPGATIWRSASRYRSAQHRKPPDIALGSFSTIATPRSRRSVCGVRCDAPQSCSRSGEEMNDAPDLAHTSAGASASVPAEQSRLRAELAELIKYKLAASICAFQNRRSTSLTGLRLLPARRVRILCLKLRIGTRSTYCWTSVYLYSIPSNTMRS
jgi:hypothetical protein